MPFCPNRSHVVALALFTATALACGAPPAPPVQGFEDIESPAATGSGESNLSLAPSGAVDMSWLERLPDSSYALRYARLTGSRWSAPVTVQQRRDLFINWADFPSVVAGGEGRLTVHWLQRSGAGTYAYDSWVSRSADGGVQWSQPIRLHRDSSAAEHGFVSLLRGAKDSVFAFWLDGRASGSGAHGGAMQLRSTAVHADGTLGTEQLLDDRTCDCCQSAAAMTSRGPVVVYRDRSADEIRDIAIVRHDGTQWTKPRPVHNDGWKIDACPVNGPAIVARGDTVAVTWFTGAREQPRVQTAFSTDGGITFGTPTRIDDGAPLGRVAMALETNGRVLVAWLERTRGDSAEVRLRRVTDGGVRSAAVLITRSSGERASGFPRLVRRRHDVVASWTDPSNGGRVRVAVARVDDR